MTPSPPTQEVRRIDHVKYIDGLRAVAVLSVVLDHGLLHNPAIFGSLPQRLAGLGMHGVELFFVISGLCLSQSYLQRFERTGKLGFDGPAFFAKRIVRILPPYYVAVVLLAALTFWMTWRIAQGATDGGPLEPALTPVAFLAHFFFADKLAQTLNASFWTLRIEAIWYVLFPALLLAYVRRPAVFWPVAVVSGALGFLGNDASGFGIAGTVFVLATALPAFMLGLVVADPRARAWPAALFAGLAFAGLALGVAGDFVHVTGDRVAWGVAAFGFVGLAQRVHWLNRLLSLRVLASVGIASYSIYLVHDPAIALCIHFGAPPFVAMAGGVAAGAAFWWLVERPLTTDPLRKRAVDLVYRALPRPPSARADGNRAA